MMVMVMRKAAAPSAQIQLCAFGTDITHTQTYTHTQKQNKTKQTRAKKKKQTKSKNKMFTTGLGLTVASLAIPNGRKDYSWITRTSS